jgi:hypothetical protein
LFCPESLRNRPSLESVPLALFVIFTGVARRPLLVTVECLPAGVQLFNELVNKLRESVRVQFLGSALA